MLCYVIIHDFVKIGFECLSVKGELGTSFLLAQSQEPVLLGPFTLAIFPGRVGLRTGYNTWLSGNGRVGAAPGLA